MGFISTMYTSHQNAKTTKSATAAALNASILYAMAAEAATKDAIAKSVSAQESANATSLEAANKAAAQAEEYIRVANATAEHAVEVGVDTSNAEFQSAYDTIKNNLMPYVEAGTDALSKLKTLTSGDPNAVNNFLTSDPGYNFRLNQGNQAVQRSAAARGGLVSGATGAALTKYSQDYASNEFNNAYSRLMSLAQLGQGSTNTLNAYRQGLAEKKSANAFTLADQRKTSAYNLANTQTYGAYSVGSVKAQGAQNLANVQSTGAYNLANAKTSGAASVMSAVQNKAYTDAAATNTMRSQGNSAWENLVSNVASVFGYGSSFKKNKSTDNSESTSQTGSSDLSGSTSNMG